MFAHHATRPRGSLPSLSWFTWIGIDDMTYRLQDGPSRPERRHHVHNSAQLMCLCWSLGFARPE